MLDDDDICMLDVTGLGAIVAIYSIYIFNCPLQMMLYIQSFSLSPLIMDHSHLSHILNKGSELEVGGAQAHISVQLLLTVAISLREK